MINMRACEHRRSSLQIALPDVLPDSSLRYRMGFSKKWHGPPVLGSGHAVTRGQLLLIDTAATGFGWHQHCGHFILCPVPLEVYFKLRGLFLQQSGNCAGDCRDKVADLRIERGHEQEELVAD